MLRITDQGPGIHTSPLGGISGLGLRGMRARVDAQGGTLTIGGEKEGGTVVTAVLPATEGHNGNGKASDQGDIGRRPSDDEAGPA